MNRLLQLVLAVSLGIVIGFFLSGWFMSRTKAPHFSEVRESGFEYINPLLECEYAGEALEETALRPFRQSVERSIDDVTGKKWADDISVYFREMNNGSTFTIGQTEKFSPASLLKVPLLMAALKVSESHPLFLTKKIRYEGLYDYNANQNIKPSVKMEPGRSYSVDELLYRMTAYSDNNAYVMVMNSIDLSMLRDTYRDLGVPMTDTGREEDYMSVQDYSAFFRILFNASYLNKELSEKALGYLAASDYKDGIVGGLPTGTKVAHKFGERVFGKDLEIKELHDCGIVYYPGHPFMLCIMSRGKSFEFLDDSIREISKKVFEEIASQHE